MVTARQPMRDLVAYLAVLARPDAAGNARSARPLPFIPSVCWTQGRTRFECAEKESSVRGAGAR